MIEATPLIREEWTDDHPSNPLPPLRPSTSSSVVSDKPHPAPPLLPSDKEETTNPTSSHFVTGGECMELMVGAKRSFGDMEPPSIAVAAVAVAAADADANDTTNTTTNRASSNTVDNINKDNNNNDDNNNNSSSSASTGNDGISSNSAIASSSSGVGLIASATTGASAVPWMERDAVMVDILSSSSFMAPAVFEDLGTQVGGQR